MNENLRRQLVTELNNALTFVGQAQNLIGITEAEAKDKDLVAMWKELGRLYDKVDDALDLVKTYFAERQSEGKIP